MRPRHQAKTGASSGTSASAAPPPTPPRTASARQRQEASFGTRKTGYQPRASAYGDEPPVTNNNYATRPEPPPRPAPEPAVPPRPHQANANTRVPDPLSQFRETTASDDRQSTPYMAHSGEKTNPFDADMGRAHAAQRSTNETSPSRDRESTSYSATDANRHRNESKADGSRQPANPQDGRSNSNGFASSPGEYCKLFVYTQPPRESPPDKMIASQVQTDSGQRNPMYGTPHKRHLAPSPRYSHAYPLRGKNMAWI